MAGAAGAYRTDRNATGVAAAYNQFKSQAQDMTRLQFKLDMLKEHHTPSQSFTSKVVDAAVSIADPLGLGWIGDTISDLSKGTSLGLDENSGSTSKPYLCSSGELWGSDGFKIENPQVVQAYTQAHKEVADIVAQGPAVIEREIMRTVRDIADYQEVGRGFASVGHVDPTKMGTETDKPKFAELEGYNTNAPKTPQPMMGMMPAPSMA